MTFLSYKLPKGAPQQQVWFAECDKCHATVGPFGNSPNQQVLMKGEIIAARWRYQNEHPVDTCPGCLAAEVRSTAENGEGKA